MTTCLRESSLQAYIEESGTGLVCRPVEGHLAACARCRVAFDRAASTHKRVHAWLAQLRAPYIGACDVNRALLSVRYRVEAFGHTIPWCARGMTPGALASSFAAQSAIVALLMLAGANSAVRTNTARFTLVEPPVAARPMQAKPNHSGGGSGQRSPLPPLKGELRKPALKVFTPPLATVEHPALVMDPSLLAPPDAWARPPGIIGDPFGLPGGAGGPGQGGSLAAGDGGTVGDGIGSGPNGDAPAGIFSAGNGTTAPVVIVRVDPEYSEEARKAKYGGSVMLSIVVSAEGRAENLRVVRSLGMGSTKRRSTLSGSGDSGPAQTKACRSGSARRWK